MRDHQVTEGEFLNHVKDHKLFILNDAGIYRHLRFQAPGTNCRYFDIVTFPGRLCYVGDMGAFTFTRLHDMFQFFRTDAREKGDRKLGINTGYWAEKLEADCKTDGHEEFDEDRFREVINEYRLEWIREAARNGTLSKGERRDLWEAVDDEVLSRVEGGEHEAFDAAHGFDHKIGRKSFTFTDLWDHHFTRYTYRFVWCCYAIAWGIQQYDQAKAIPAQTGVSDAAPVEPAQREEQIQP